MRIGIGSDHAGFCLKEFLKGEIIKEGYEVVDVGPDISRSVDYPDFAAKIARAVQNGEIDSGILICGTGIGMSIAANRFDGVRAARCCSLYDALLAREHNNANVLALGSRLVAEHLAFKITMTFLDTPFLKGRHANRVNKIDRLNHQE